MARLCTIVWDIDDVLNELTLEWLEHAWRPSRPDCHVPYAALKRNPPHEFVGASLTEYLDSLDVFRASAHGQDLRPCSDALAWFQQHGHRFRHIALTARPFESAGLAAEWVIRHFGRWIRTVGFVPSARSTDERPIYDQTKADWLRATSLGDVIVDDSEANVDAATEVGLLGIVMPQPWNSAATSRYAVFERLALLSNASDFSQRAVGSVPV